jgi:hypothetical protein
MQVHRLKAEFAGAALLAAAATVVTSVGAASADQHRVGRPHPPGVISRAATEPAPLVTDRLVRSGAVKVGLAAPVMSTPMVLANRTRQAAALRYLSRHQVPVQRLLAGTQQPQILDYYCGPATVSEMLAQMSVTLSQKAAARQLGTTPGGTDWSNQHGYPVPRVLNKNQHRSTYVAVALPWVPTAAQIKTYKIDLVTDMNKNGGVPIAGNAYEVPGGPHLVGHPPGSTIMHWFDIRGYEQNGSITAYEDSVHGASSIGWSTAVPAYSTLSSATIVDIVGARGYVW